MKQLLPLLFLLAQTVPARAQSINVDFEPASTPFGLPTPNYAGPAGAGVWNPVSSVFVPDLRRWDGAVSSASLLMEMHPMDGCDSHDSPETTGQDEALIDDGYGGDEITASFLFQGLEPGNYVVDTIIARRFCHTGLGVAVEGSPDPTQGVMALWDGEWVLHWNFARHSKTVTDGTIRVIVIGSQSVYIEVAGIQLSMGEQELPGTPICFGDGVAAACPCSNSGPEGHGCQNSAGTGGAVLFATGTTSPDTVVLHASGELPTALSIFLQGNASITPVVYGDGLRCTGGTLRRLYTKSASGGEASAPEAGDPSITVRSAQLGVPIPADGRRYYQVYYRDANAGFCAAPQGSTFNVSSAVRINW